MEGNPVSSGIITQAVELAGGGSVGEAGTTVGVLEDRAKTASSSLSSLVQNHSSFRTITLEILKHTS